MLAHAFPPGRRQELTDHNYAGLNGGQPACTSERKVADAGAGGGTECFLPMPELNDRLSALRMSGLCQGERLFWVGRSRSVRWKAAVRSAKGGHRG
jgi:hypothetical protein